MSSMRGALSRWTGTSGKSFDSDQLWAGELIAMVGDEDAAFGIGCLAELTHLLTEMITAIAGH